MMDPQEHLLYITNLMVQRDNNPKIRCVSALWKDSTAWFTFYFDGAVTEEDRDAASDICTYVIADFSYGLLEEHFFRWDYPKPLPQVKYIAYKRENE